MRKRFGLFLTLSVFVHVSVVVLIHFAKKPTEQPIKKSLQIVELKTPSPSARAKTKSPSNVARGQSSPTKFLNNDFMKSQWTKPTLHDAESEIAGASEGRSDDPHSAWGSGAADFKRLEDLGLMNRIYDRLDSYLFYPSILSNHGIEGVVNARLVIGESGSCDWHETTIASTDSHLRVFVLSLLKKVCQQNFKAYLRDRKLTNVDITIEFALTEHNDPELIENNKHILGNLLFLYRNSQHSIAEWHLGPLHGLFPIPYVSIDFGWLKENWEKVVDKKDPLKEYEASVVN